MDEGITKDPSLELTETFPLFPTTTYLQYLEAGPTLTPEQVKKRKRAEIMEQVTVSKRWLGLQPLRSMVLKGQLEGVNFIGIVDDMLLCTDEDGKVCLRSLKENGEVLQSVDLGTSVPLCYTMTDQEVFIGCHDGWVHGFVKKTLAATDMKFHHAAGNERSLGPAVRAIAVGRPFSRLMVLTAGTNPEMEVRTDWFQERPKLICPQPGEGPCCAIEIMSGTVISAVGATTINVITFTEALKFTIKRTVKNLAHPRPVLADAYITHVLYLSESDTIVVGGAEGRVYMCDTAYAPLTNHAVHDEDTFVRHVVARDKHLITGGSDGKLKIIARDSGKVLSTREWSAPIVALARTEKYLVVAGSNGDIDVMHFK